MTRNALRARGERSYWVWIKGDRTATQTVVSADKKDEALWKYAKRYGVKTVACDGSWIRNLEQTKARR